MCVCPGSNRAAMPCSVSCQRQKTGKGDMVCWLHEHGQAALRGHCPPVCSKRRKRQRKLAVRGISRQAPFRPFAGLTHLIFLLQNEMVGSTATALDLGRHQIGTSGFKARSCSKALLSLGQTCGVHMRSSLLRLGSGQPH